MLIKPLILVCAFWVSVCSSVSVFSNRYDQEFIKSAFYLPVGTDWRLLKAQCFQESSLNPFAESHAGAMGLCQFLPGTWKDIQKRYPTLANPYDPKQSIMAAAVYMGDLNRGWSFPRPAMDRYMLALASYNAGFGNILKAQKAADDALTYPDIISKLPQITGRHSQETTEYVHKIVRVHWLRMMFK